MNINSICVCGAGTMGAGIAQAAAQSGISTILFDLNQGILDKASSAIDKNLSALVGKQKISEEQKQRIQQRLQFTSDLQYCLADVFIEAIVEKPAAKIALFNQLAEINHGESVFASNTSSLSLEKIAEQVKGPERLIGMHFFNPATIMKLVEVVNTRFTSPAATELILELARQMGKTAVICRDSPGFIVNRVARPFYIETMRLVEEGIVDLEQADRLLEATGFKMGPFRLMDLIGNDINYAVSTSVYEQLGQPERLRPSGLQLEKLEAGKLGKKSGEGFYRYV
ncbi:MAG: 3-hydroxybutyryl-CoA dehydrogenase [Chitinophagaceae bacterium]|nr:3-hydroxybutyryl-CoA dehydrogenase [Chitinophagaceae bacterium]